MKFEDHCERTKQRTGFEMPEVHRYLDQYFPYFRSANHWLILHHRKGIDKIVRMFGNNYGYEGSVLVRIAAEGHIVDDMGEVFEEPSDMEHFFMVLHDEDEMWLDKLLAKEFS